MIILKGKAQLTSSLVTVVVMLHKCERLGLLRDVEGSSIAMGVGNIGTIPIID